jgi:hypothetical protein
LVIGIADVEGRRPFDSAQGTKKEEGRSKKEEGRKPFDTSWPLSPSATLRVNCVEGFRVQRRKKEEEKGRIEWLTFRLIYVNIAAN